MIFFFLRKIFCQNSTEKLQKLFRIDNTARSFDFFIGSTNIPMRSCHMVLMLIKFIEFYQNFSAFHVVFANNLSAKNFGTSKVFVRPQHVFAMF